MAYTAAVITISDKGYRGEREDTSGPNLVKILTEKGFDVTYTAIVPDEAEMIQSELLKCADEKKIALNPAYELSFLKKEEQVDLLDAMDSEQATPSLSQAQRLKKYSQEGHLTLDMMRVIMGEEKKSDLDRVTFTSDTLRKYFPKSYTPQRMQETIIKLLEQWQRKRQRDQER